MTTPTRLLSSEFSLRCLPIGFCLLLVAAAAHAQAPIDQYSSTGDNRYSGNWLPLNTEAAIDASFDLLNDVFSTRRIYWRGMQDQVLIESTPRPENIVQNSFLQYLDYSINTRGLNDYAVQAAQSRGMEIWGQTGLYDWGSTANIGVYGFPAADEHPIRVQNPEWVPVDKYGVRRQGGPLEFAYSGARTASVNWIDDQLQNVGYDGVLLHTYAENFGMRFVDEFGFSDPIVDEFKSRYGVDIRRETFNRQDWYELRGEYTTTYLEELNAAISPDGKKIGMAINPLDTDRPQLWLGNNSFPTAGNIDLDWQKWAQDGTVDQLVVWGGTGSTAIALDELIAGTSGSSVELSAMTSSPYATTWDPYKTQGYGVTQFQAFEWQYLTASNIPTQPKSSLSNPDQYLRMKTLAQIIEGTLAATTAEVTPLLSDSNLLNRRMALTAMGKIGDTAAIVAMENALTDSDSSVRNAAVYGLLDANRVESYNALINAVAANGEFPLMEGAFRVLIQRPEWRAQLANTLATNADSNVRVVASRSLSNFGNSLTASEIAVVAASAQAPEPEIRAFAIDTLGQVMTLNSPLAIQTLVDALASSDTIVASRAATALSFPIVFQAPAAEARRAELIGLMGDAFAAHGDGTQRLDKDWGYRVIGNALMNLGSEGRDVLQPMMDQRKDRRLSELAWEVIHIRLRSHQVDEVTEVWDNYVQFKRPRWDAVVAAADSFDSQTLGASIDNLTPETGLQWLVPSDNAAGQVIQNQFARSGNALKAVREAGELHLIKLVGYDREIEAAELTTVTAKADWMRFNNSDSTLLTIGLIGGLIGPSIYADPAGNYLYWQTDGTFEGGSYLNTGFDAGTGAWETIELVLTLNLGVNGQLSGSYDVFLEREAGGSLAALERTLIADDISNFTIPEQTLIELLISNQGVSTTYWDNVSLTVDGVFPLTADFNGDGFVDGVDLADWEGGFGTATGATHPMGDADEDGDVDGFDFLAWQREWTGPSGLAATSTAVPEPSTFVLLVCCVPLLALSRCCIVREMI